MSLRKFRRASLADKINAKDGNAVEELESKVVEVEVKEKKIKKTTRNKN